MTEGESGEGFDIDLEKAKIREQKVKDIFEKGKIEVKTDFKFNLHNKVFIEYQSFGKPSGIKVTKADWWIIQLPDACQILIETNRLKWLFKKAYDKYGSTKGGDYDKSYGVLIPTAWFTRPWKPLIWVETPLTR